MHPCSLVRSATDPSTQNLCLAPANGETAPPPTVLRSIRDSLQPVAAPDGDPPDPPVMAAPTNGEPNDIMEDEPEVDSPQLVVMDVEALVGKTFPVDKDNGQQHRARIVEAVKDHEDKAEENNCEFRCSLNNEECEELFTYQQISLLQNGTSTPVWIRSSKGLQPRRQVLHTQWQH